MTTIKHGLLLSLLLVTALAPAPLMAADKDDKRRAGDSERVRERTRDACREIARDRDYTIVDVGDVRVDGNDGHVRMRLKRKGDSFAGDCRFDGSSRRANLVVDEAGGGGGGDGVITAAERERAERACRAEARNNKYEVRDVGREQRVGRDRLNMEMDLRRNDRRFEAVCVYDISRSTTALTVEEVRGNNNKNDRVAGQPSNETVKNKCIEAGRERGMTPGVHDKVDHRANGMSVMLITFEQREGGLARYRCLFDNRDKSVSLELYKGS